MAETWQEDRYRDILKTPAKNWLLNKIWRDAYEDDYPEDADPFGFATVSDLESISAELHLKKYSRLLDVGCGRGGPGLWVARKTHSLLTGLDILAEAIEQANSLKVRMGMADAATFGIGSFADTGLPSCSQQAVMSVDAFWMVLDKTAALREMARIIEPGGSLVMTTWVPRRAELEAMLITAGFRLLSCQETPRWKERQMAVYRGILRHRDELERQVGPVSTGILVAEAKEAAARLGGSPRCLVVAVRQS
ncbi:MAG TPA: class I SAM-dependent methyltransferase [Bryobacteraceae bacterium]|jgi:cyclopropane fatty-acyl-phospholipid synthase-like methyltransferase|nr:class I SAM-dependent methyltransferase [Bryobacteraceae bacterium]